MPSSAALSEHSVPNTSTPSPHLYHVFEEAVSKHGPREAVVSLHQPPDLYAEALKIEPLKGPGLRWTYDNVHRAATRFACSLEARGVKKGDIVTTFVSNGIEWCVIIWACWRIGAVFAPMGLRNVQNAEETKYMLQAAAVKVLIVANTETALRLDDLASQADLALKLKIVLDSSGELDGWDDFPSLIKCSGESDESLLTKPAAQLVDSDAAIIFFTVVYPAGVFTPAAMLNALTKEGCNEAVLVPTMVYALISIMSEQKIPRLENLECVSMGGASVSEKNLEDASVRLGSSLVCAGYGMSEGLPMRPVKFKTAAEGIIQGNPCCGEVTSGCAVKICSPGTTTAVPINTPGELHMSGSPIITGYLGGRNKEDFYDEGGKRWFRTGDQAVMDEQQRIAIVGRYKDMIIRGGENISPNAMERVLSEIGGIEAHVVGAEDEIAGENLTGKVLKDQLALIVKQHRASITKSHTDATSKQDKKFNPSSHIVTVTWASLLGIEPEDLDPEAQTATFADSINMMRFRQKIRQETGKIITVEQVLGSTIAEQIKIVDNQSTRSNELPGRPTPEYRPGGPSVVDMVHCYGDEERAAATREVVEAVLKPHGLSWDNVSEVFPAWGLGQAIFTQKRDLSWDFRFFINTKVKDAKVVRAALEAALEKNPNHLSFFVREDGSVTNRKSLGLHINLKTSKDLFDSIISYAPKPLRTIAELQKYSDDQRLDVGFDSLLTRAEIVHVMETDSVHIVLNVNHVAHDAMSLQGLLFPDLDLAISDPLSLKSHTPYKIFADTYHSLSTSLTAQEGVKFHVEHLRDITCHKKAAAWPPQRAPGWVLGPRRGWITPPADATGAGHAAYSNPAGLPLEDEPSRRSDGGSAPVAWRGELPGLNAFRASVGEGLTNPSIAKVALALLNVRHTGHTHAIFGSVEAGRASLPFIPASLSGPLAAADVNPADMPGPMYQRLANLIRVDRAETVGDLLRRVQELQSGQSRHCHAPLDAICEALGPEGGEMVLDTCRRQLLNWVPGLGAMDRNPFKNIELLDSRSRADLGVMFFAGTGGKAGQDLVLKVIWDDANVTRSEAEKWLSEYRALIQAVVSGGKDRLVGEVFDSVKDA
ncbi:hypothetical protein KVR01_001676 [Diaporthe batatas]|uniref:uncharacterized protein n=1 Tax=Diaporthe batatas TaxID=748121 RepID=UPI001D04AB11|nr:uncharacterized protein KVR01_001676 [Diaporthe batatas]KAG8168927.1 hypothetical protein KVR01_001676 [Diaporthe batatas]